MKIKNRQQFLTLATIVLVALFAADRMVLSPLIRAWKERSSRIAELTKAVSKGALLLDRERTIKSRWAEMRTNALPSNTALAQDAVMKSVFRWSQESGFGLTSAKPQPRPAEDYTTIECRADGKGSIEEYRRLLAQAGVQQ